MCQVPSSGVATLAVVELEPLGWGAGCGRGSRRRRGRAAAVLEDEDACDGRDRERGDQKQEQLSSAQSCHRRLLARIDPDTRYQARDEVASA